MHVFISKYAYVNGALSNIFASRAAQSNKSNNLKSLDYTRP